MIGQDHPVTCTRHGAAAAIAVLALFGCSGGKELPASVLRTIERDPGFLLMPPGSKIIDQASRRDCVDASGDIPSTWRELDPAGLSITEVNGFFRTQLPQHGWVADPYVLAAGTTTSKWSRNIGGRPVVLHIWLGPDLVTVIAEVPCG